MDLDKAILRSIKQILIDKQVDAPYPLVSPHYANPSLFLLPMSCFATEHQSNLFSLEYAVFPPALLMSLASRFPVSTCFASLRKSSLFLLPMSCFATEHQSDLFGLEYALFFARHPNYVSFSQTLSQTLSQNKNSAALSQSIPEGNNNAAKFTGEFADASFVPLSQVPDTLFDDLTTAAGNLPLQSNAAEKSSMESNHRQTLTDKTDEDRGASLSSFCFF